MLRYAITEGHLRPTSSRVEVEAWIARCTLVLAQNVDYLLVREKALEAGMLVALCRRLQALAGQTRVLVSGRADVAMAAGLAGVHLSAAPGELTPGQIRQVMPGAYVSVSCHSLAEVKLAQANGADAVLFGPVFGKVVDGVEVAAGVGLKALQQACGLGVPVFALGGVDGSNTAACAAAGAAGVAGIRAYFS